MGEVYLAQDSRLDRKVALKLLSPQFARDAERILRFTQEARAASALNHPNIITIFDIGEADGTPYMATEFIDGETLRQRLAKGPLRLSEVLEYAIQTAGALAAAHQAGIVHRDIKPENIMLRADGYVKVVDFGLAKLTDRTPAPGDSGTVLMGPAVTTMGTVMGTAQYMSPEQARGQAIDGRTDIFSFSVVLYEMLAGRPPFTGETPSHQIVAILEKDPPPLAASGLTLPPDLEAIVRKGLAKPLDQRYQSMQEMLADLKGIAKRIDLEQTLHESGRFIPSSAVTSPQPAAGPAAKARSKWLLPIAGAIVLAAVAGWFGYTRLAHRQPFENYTIDDLTDSGKVRAAVISPDGRYAVFVQIDRGEATLYIRQIATATNVQIQPAARVNFSGLTFSRDGNYLFFTRQLPGSADSTLYRVPSLGGEPAKMLDGVYSAVAFSPDDKQMAYMTVDLAKGGSSLVVSKLDGSGARTLKRVQAPEAVTSDPAWSPDGKWIAIALARPGSSGYRGQLLLISPDGKERIVGDNRWAGILTISWTPESSGMCLLATTPGVVTAIQIWFQPLSGEPRQITKDVNSIFSGLSATADGKTLLSVKQEVIAGLHLMNAAEPASDRPLGNASSNYTGVLGMAWDGANRFLYTAKSKTGIDVWIRDTAESANAQRLTNDNAMLLHPKMSSDGKTMWFGSNRSSGIFHVWSMDMDSKQMRQLTSGKGEMVESATADGKSIYYAITGAPGIWRINADGSGATQVLTQNVNGAAVSPDGQWLAYVFLDSGAGRRVRLGVLPANGAGEPKVFDFAARGGNFLNWTPDGKAVSYTGNVAGVGQVWVQPVDGGTPRQVTAYAAGNILSYEWSPDGKQLLLSRGSLNADAVIIRQK